LSIIPLDAKSTQQKRVQGQGNAEGKYHFIRVRQNRNPFLAGIAAAVGAAHNSPLLGGFLDLPFIIKLKIN
jgi:hypothetical protein